MPVKPNKKLEIAGRRQQVAELYVQGHTQCAIGQRLAISQPTVCDDLRQTKQQWRASAIRDFDAARDLELQKLDKVEREAWAAWDRSQKPAQSAVISGEGAGQRTRKSVKNQNGDLRALELVLKCNQARRTMLGLDAPTRIAPVTPDGQEPYRLAVESLSVIELRALARLREHTVTLEEGESSERVD
jgi:hypothetical protein